MAYGCALGLARSLEYLLEIDVERIFAYNQYVRNLLVEGLRERDVEITSPNEETERRSIMAARFRRNDPSEVARKLKRAQVMVSCRRNLVRFSPHLYNRSGDIEKALACLDEIV